MAFYETPENHLKNEGILSHTGSGIEKYGYICPLILKTS